MERQPPFSHGLLYSITPETFSELHLHDEDEADGFDWEENTPPFAAGALAQAVLKLLKIINMR